MVVEVGTGGGRGSTVAIHRALAACKCPFQLVGYEGDAELARRASQFWSEAGDTEVVNEYFMHREDIDSEVKSRVVPEDRVSYIPEFNAVAGAGNFLTPPPGRLTFCSSTASATRISRSSGRPSRGFGPKRSW